MKTRLLLAGTEFRILELAGANGRWPVAEFIGALVRDDQRRLLSLLDRVAENGVPANTEKFAKLTGKIFEFKAYQTRIPCFFRPAKVIVATHGFTKKGDKTDRREIERAQRGYDEFIRSGGVYE